MGLSVPSRLRLAFQLAGLNDEALGVHLGLGGIQRGEFTCLGTSSDELG